jgi:hypothetical protein
VIGARAAALSAAAALLAVSAGCSSPRPEAPPGNGVRTIHADVRGIT